MTNQTASPSRARRVLVIGATASVGRHVVDGLLEEGAQVRALTRDPLAAGFPDGVEAAQGDLGRPESIESAADGMDAAFLLWRSCTGSGRRPRTACGGRSRT